MSRLLQIIRTIFVSAEFLIVIISLAVGLFFSEYLTLIANYIEPINSFIEYLALLPPGMLAFFVIRRDSLLFIPDDKGNALQKWPLYQQLTDTFWVGCGWLLLCTLVVVTIWGLNLLATPYGLLCFVAAMVISVVSSCSLLFARDYLKKSFIIHHLSDNIDEK